MRTLYISPLKIKKGNGIFSLLSIIDNEKWSSPEPVNTLNSQEDEILPYQSDDGKKLYFSSNGLAGMGGFDIYVSYWDEKRNGNMGYSSKPRISLFVSSR